MRFLILLLLLFSSCSSPIETSKKTDEQLKIEIIRLLNKWAEDFNAKNIEGVCGLFGQDLVATYPGTPDRNYDMMCQGLSATLQSSERSFHYEPPEIEQILVENDLAVARLVWHLGISSSSGTENISERGVDVFTRDKDGNWKITISYAYPMP